MRTLRFHQYGEPAEVLQLDDAPVPLPARDRLRAAVHACGLNPADWALCKGLFPGQLPRGVGLDVAGIVDAVGEGVTDVAVGDPVLGSADFAGGASAGASDFAILNHWAKAPAKLDFVHAAALPMAVVIAATHLDALGVTAGQTIVISGAGTVIGFAAAQIALLRGARVIASAGQTYAERLRALGVKVTSYGEGMAERIRELAGGPVDLALDTAPVFGDPAVVNKVVQGGAVEAKRDAPVTSALPALVQAAGGDPKRVLTISDLQGAAKLGVRTTFGEKALSMRYDLLGEFAERAAQGTFSVPVARTFALDDWRAAVEISLSRQARGKLVLRLRAAEG
jgi:NADPH:quinone reductase-like Zn-dependent oxidoreductase